MNLTPDRLLSFHRANSLRSWAAAPVKYQSPRRFVGFLLVTGLMFVACHSAQAANPPTFRGYAFVTEKKVGTHSYVKTSDNKILLDGVDNALIGETNYPGSLSAFPGKKIDVVMQQCFGGGFAKGMQQFLDEYTFSAATNWNEYAYNEWNVQNPATLMNFTASWVQGLPRGEGRFQHFLNVVEGAPADGPKPAVSPDPFGPDGVGMIRALGQFENPTFASPDPPRSPIQIDENGPNNSRQLTLDNNQWAILMATQPDSRRFSTNIKRVYDALRVGIPANQIIVLYGDSAANTTTPDGTPINGPITRNNFFSATSGGNSAGNLFGSIRGLGDQGIPDQMAATPGENSRLFVYNTGHGSSFTLNGATRLDTVSDNKFGLRVDAMPGNGFVTADGNALPVGDTTSFVGLQFSTQTPLNPGVTVVINGTSIGSLLDDNVSPETDLSPFLGTLYNYRVDVPLSFFQMFPIGSPLNIELDNLASMYDSLVSAVTFNNYGDAWSVSVRSIPEPSHIALLVSGLMTVCVFQRRH